MFSCVGDSLRWTAGAIEVVATIEYDDDADTSYLEQEGWEDRLAQYQRDDFYFCGIVARVLLDVDGRDVEIGQCSIWGIESDSGEEYLEEIAREMATEAIEAAGQYMPALARLLAEHEQSLNDLRAAVA